MLISQGAVARIQDTNGQLAVHAADGSTGHVGRNENVSMCPTELVARWSNEYANRAAR
jgi:hypothetical protein